MFCSNCGSKIDQGGLFCPNCGQKATSSEPGTVSPEKRGLSEDTPQKAIFYSDDWRRRKGIAIASLPYCDLLVDDEKLYVIKIPTYYAGFWGFIIGLIILNIIGAAIGGSIGGARDRKKRQWYRSAWINSEKKLTSRHYMDAVLLAVPLADLKGNIIFGKRKFTLTHGNERIILVKNLKEFERFKQYVEKYVL